MSGRLRTPASKRRAPKRDTYHHGGLREALMSAALVAIERDGIASVSLRELARDLGVSHGAPAHHFQDRTGLFTALAAAGFDRLREQMEQAVAVAADTPAAKLSATGRAYVLFAAENRGYFEVMFHPGLLRPGDAAFEASRDKASHVLQEAIAAVRAGGRASSRKRKTKGGDRKPGPDVEWLKAWSVAHGLASLWLTGNIPPALAPDGIEALVQEVFQAAASANAG
jgi:AcrR family transcriptional regulator